MKGIAKGRISRKKYNGIDNRCCNKKGNSRVTGDLLFQKTIDNGDDSTFTRGEKYPDKGSKKDSPPTISREKMINLVRCDINLNQPRNNTSNQNEGESFNDNREKNSPSLKHTGWELLESSHLVFLFCFGFFLFVIRESNLFQIREFRKLFKHLVQVVSFCKFYSHRCTSILNSTSIILLF